MTHIVKFKKKTISKHFRTGEYSLKVKFKPKIVESTGILVYIYHLKSIRSLLKRELENGLK